MNINELNHKSNKQVTQNTAPDDVNFTCKIPELNLGFADRKCTMTIVTCSAHDFGIAFRPIALIHRFE